MYSFWISLLGLFLPCYNELHLFKKKKKHFKKIVHIWHRAQSWITLLWLLLGIGLGVLVLSEGKICPITTAQLSLWTTLFCSSPSAHLSSEHVLSKPFPYTFLCTVGKKAPCWECSHFYCRARFSKRSVEYYHYRLKRDFLKCKGFESKDTGILKSRCLHICKLFHSKQIFFS